jgi:hypothetical protein
LEDEFVDELTLRVDHEGDEPMTVTAHVWAERQYVQFVWEPTRVETGEQTVRIERDGRPRGNRRVASAGLGRKHLRLAPGRKLPRFLLLTKAPKYSLRTMSKTIERWCFMRKWVSGQNRSGVVKHSVEHRNDISDQFATQQYA